ncbi:MAG: hypothetical protein OXU20_32345 [Myxococcales bacterium]|nr:hypothetical protein [Myxococcales bacterium]
MELADVKIAVGIDVQLLKGLVQFLYDREVIPKNISQGGLVLTLEAPAIEVDNPSGAGEGPVLALRVTGMFALSGNPSPFDAKLALEPFVRAGTAGAAPVAALRAGDVISITPASAQAVFGVVATAFLNDVLANLDLPLFDPLIAQVEAAFFPDDPPARSTWAADFFLGKESELEHRDIGFPPGRPDLPRVDTSSMLPTTPALMATIALPGEAALLPDGPSIVPRATGIQILIAEPTMNAVLAAQAASRVGTDFEGARVTRLAMEMRELGVQITGEAEKDPATIRWDGTLLLFHSKRFVRSTSGTIRWHDGFVNVFASGVDVEVDIPWWVTFLRVLGGIVLGPIGWILDATLVQPKLSEADDAPDLVRSAFREQVSDALREMVAKVANIGDATDAPVMVFGHDAWVLAGNYTTSLIAFAGSNDASIASIEHDTFEVEGAHGSSVGLLTLNTGHILHPEEAGRLMKAGIVRIPNHHGVEAPYGFYVRSNADDSPLNNLVDPSEIHVD